MDKANISISPTKHDIVSCNVCFARNYQTQDKTVGEYVQDLYDVRIGSFVSCLCPKCLAVLQRQIGNTLQNRALPEVFAIVKGGDFTLRIVKGRMEFIGDAEARVIVKIDALTENVFTFKREDVRHFVFDTKAEAENRLVELTSCPSN